MEISNVFIDIFYSSVFGRLFLFQNGKSCFTTQCIDILLPVSVGLPFFLFGKYS